MGAESADISRIWPQWKTVSVLGHGSYGSVYQVAKDDFGIRAYSAVKVIHVPQNPSETRELEMSGMDMASMRTYYESQVTRIADEIRVMETLESAPNIVSIKDHFIEQQQDGIGWNIYIRMELLEPLDHYVQKHGEMSEADVIRLGCDICTALAYCGSRKIIHRDIKPSNVFLDQFGNFKLGDFGIARRMNEGSASVYSMKGTIRFMAPEVAKGQSYGSTVDIYSLGIMMYWFLNHFRYPFEPPYPQQLTPDDVERSNARRLAGDIVPPPGKASPQLANIILKACRPDPAGRWQTPQAMLSALRSVAAGNYQGSAAGNYQGSAGRAPQHNQPSGSGTMGQTPSTGNYTGQTPPPSGRTGKNGQGGRSGKKAGLIIGLAALLGAAVLAFVLLHAGSGKTGTDQTAPQQPESEEHVSETSEASITDPNTLKSSVKIKDYSFYDWTWDESEVSTSGEEYLITNDSSVPVTVRIDASYVKDDGETKYGSRTVWHIAPGETKLTEICFDGETGEADIYYDYSVTEADESDPDVKSCDTSGITTKRTGRNGNTVYFTVTNESGEDRENVDVGILRFKDSELQGTGLRTFGHLSPGESQEYSYTVDEDSLDGVSFITGPGQYD